MGTASPSVSAQVADVQRLVERSGLKYVMHSAGTTLGTSSSLIHLFRQLLLYNWRYTLTDLNFPLL